MTRVTSASPTGRARTRTRSLPTGGTNQQWKIEPTADGYYKLTARHSGKCLDVESGSTAAGARIHQWDCYSGLTSQQWKIEFVQPAARLAAAGSLSREAAPALALYPNPASGQVTCVYHAAKAQRAKLVLTDLLARPLKEQAVQLLAGDNRLQVDVDKLPKGLYLVTLQLPGRNEVAKLAIE